MWNQRPGTLVDQGELIQASSDVRSTWCSILGRYKSPETSGGTQEAGCNVSCSVDARVFTCTSLREQVPISYLPYTYMLRLQHTCS